MLFNKQKAIFAIIMVINDSGLYDGAANQWETGDWECAGF